MKTRQQKEMRPIKLVNPLNQENWWCLDYNKIHSVDGVDYIFVFKPEKQDRQVLMRKDALKKATL